MIRLPLAAALAVLLVSCNSAAPPPAVAPQADAQASERAFDYPATRAVDAVDDYFDQRVFDPYRWMEDLDSPELATWIAAQNQLVQGYIADAPGRERIKQRLAALWNFERFGVPQVRGGRYFYTRNDGLQNQAPVYWQAALDAEPGLLVDPNTLSADGTISLADWEASDDGKLLAYALSDGGSDWRTIKVRNVDDRYRPRRRDPVGQVHVDRMAPRRQRLLLQPLRRSRRARKRAQGREQFQKLYFHRIGTPQARTSWSTSVPTSPTGASSPRSATTATIWWSSSPRAPTSATAVLQDLRRADAPGRDCPHFEATSTSSAGDGQLFCAHRRRRRALSHRRHRPRQARRGAMARGGSAGRRDTLLSASVVGGQIPRAPPHDARSTVDVHDLQAASRCATRRCPDWARRGLCREGSDDEPSSRSPRSPRRHDLSLRRASAAQSAVFRAAQLASTRRLRDPPGVLRDQGRHADPDVHHRRAARRSTAATHAALRLRRLQHPGHTGLQPVDRGLARDGRRLRGAEPARRR